MIFGDFLKKKNKILLIGSSGTLGSAIKKNFFFKNIDCPQKKKLNISKPYQIKKFLKNEYDIIINCAAISKVAECEKNKKLAYKTNVVGVKKLVKEILLFEKKNKKKIFLIHISSDAVYPANRGNNKETSKLLPYNYYGKTKLKSEKFVKKLKKFLIVRTRFFDKNKIRFKDGAIDIFSSMLEVNVFVKNLVFLIKIGQCGILNVGGARQSDYKIFKKYKKNIKKTYAKLILKHLNYKIATDASLDTSLLKKLKRYEKS